MTYDKILNLCCKEKPKQKFKKIFNKLKLNESNSIEPITDPATGKTCFRNIFFYFL